MIFRKGGTPREARGNALWGHGGRGGDSRARPTNGGRIVVVLVAALVLALPAGARGGNGNGSGWKNEPTYVAPGVLQAAAKKRPDEPIRVIVQANGGSKAAKHALRGFGAQRREFKRLGIVAVDLTPAELQRLAAEPGLTITLDAPMRLAGFTSSQLWPHQNGVARLWGPALHPVAGAPAIAIVDSGIDKNHPSFGDGRRIVAREVITKLEPNSHYDGRGHGTLVAGLAAGEAAGYAGASPTSNLIDLDVMDDSGRAMTSDVIAACEWILQNRDSKRIRVANLSLHSTSVLSIRYHPLNRAVQKLWFSGIVVVAAAGNYGGGDRASGVVHAPGNDPFAITVGALDLVGTHRISDDAVAPWSAYGYTNEGFAKPDVVAAGRYMVGPVPAGSTLAAERPDRLVAPGYMQLSGTSYSAPVISGIAAQVLARHPGWTPDQVKGAIMATARRVPDAGRLEQGRGAVNAVRAAAIPMPPNPNAALAPFVVDDPAGGGYQIFDASAWYDAIRTDANWDASAWSDSGWTDSAWTDSAWTDSAWTDSAWSESSVNDSAWADSAWTDGLAYEDNAAGEPVGPVYELTPYEALAAAEDAALALP